MATFESPLISQKIIYKIGKRRMKASFQYKVAIRLNITDRLLQEALEYTSFSRTTGLNFYLFRLTTNQSGATAQRTTIKLSCISCSIVSHFTSVTSALTGPCHNQDLSFSTSSSLPQASSSTFPSGRFFTQPVSVSASAMRRVD